MKDACNIYDVICVGILCLTIIVTVFGIIWCKKRNMF